MISEVSMIYKQIVFDVDGTLIDTEYATLHSLQDTIKELQQRTVPLAELSFAMSLPDPDSLKRLGIKDIRHGVQVLRGHFQQYLSTISIFKGIRDLLETLKKKNYSLGIITSQMKLEWQTNAQSFQLEGFFDTVICADDCTRHKPDPEPMQLYLERTGVSEKEVLYLGDRLSDMQCASASGVDCGLVLWSRRSVQHIQATYYFNRPDDVLSLLNKESTGRLHQPWLSWGMELQALAQAGLTYSKDLFDRERFDRVRDIAAEILSMKSGFSKEDVKEIFCNETGYQTPKLDTRAAIFNEEKILLVKENVGTWSLPGGWVDVDQSIKSNTIKEIKEEAGLDAVPVRIIAVQDRSAHNLPVYAHGVCKIFVQCEIIGGKFEKNSETSESRFFGLDELPPLSEEKNTIEQIRMCFRASKDKSWQTQFD
jgi:haloacid dehalogenase superfamily, subfamily IA, variant 1 with third motif having Dx(3-4)D or Dx(3-4)E